MVRLLSWDPDEEVMLLERLRPGTLLSTEEDDEKATSIAASVMRQIKNSWLMSHHLPMRGILLNKCPIFLSNQFLQDITRSTKA